MTIKTHKVTAFMQDGCYRVLLQLIEYLNHH